jgi:hypothetical protein
LERFGIAGFGGRGRLIAQKLLELGFEVAGVYDSNPSQLTDAPFQHSRTWVVSLTSYLLMTEIHSTDGLSHIFFGIGLASVILLLRPRATAKVVILKEEGPDSSRFQSHFLLGKCSTYLFVSTATRSFPVRAQSYLRFNA